jgi:hypothetical protein
MGNHGFSSLYLSSNLYTAHAMVHAFLDFASSLKMVIWLRNDSLNCRL